MSDAEPLRTPSATPASTVPSGAEASEKAGEVDPNAPKNPEDVLSDTATKLAELKATAGKPGQETPSGLSSQGAEAPASSPETTNPAPDAAKTTGAKTEAGPAAAPTQVSQAPGATPTGTPSPASSTPGETPPSTPGEKSPTPTETAEAPIDPEKIAETIVKTLDEGMEQLRRGDFVKAVINLLGAIIPLFSLIEKLPPQEALALFGKINDKWKTRGKGPEASTEAFSSPQALLAKLGLNEEDTKNICQVRAKAFLDFLEHPDEVPEGSSDQEIGQLLAMQTALGDEKFLDLKKQFIHNGLTQKYVADHTEATVSQFLTAERLRDWNSKNDRV